MHCNHVSVSGIASGVEDESFRANTTDLSPLLLHG